MRFRVNMFTTWKKVMREQLTNASLRERFGVDEKNKAAVSRYIREAVEDDQAV